MTTKARDQYGLLPWQREFADLYLTGKDDQRGNAMACYLALRPSVKESTAKTNGPALLRKCEAYLAAQAEQATVSAGVTVERVMQEMARIAFVDPRKLFDANGNLVPIHDLDDDTAAALAAVDVIKIGGDDAITTVKVRLVPKTTALEQLAKALQMFVKKVEHSADDSLTQLLAEISGSTLGPPSQR